ncbi:hypothetical protein Nepgr_024229 [Nepenthes gracilis]|uniref:Autophagy-related protein n=1 Tax=Nepenthes gracilis TaxID=150966 RepID=A0AAD3T5P1_NEPGR|nr:hypothetical protein Nepgr_024229 [Nepenthes gracilis]
MGASSAIEIGGPTRLVGESDLVREEVLTAKIVSIEEKLQRRFRFLLSSSAVFAATMARSSFKQEHDFEKRCVESARIREKYPDRIPVIAEKAERSDIPNIDKKKYLVPADLTVGQFVYVIRKRIKLSAEKAIFIFVDNVLPPTGAILSSIYEEKKDEDGFLYVTYSGENTFGVKRSL